MPHKGPYTSRQHLNIIYERDKGLCWICLLLNKPAFVKRKDASRDHYMAKADGGSDDFENLRLAHKKCNSLRGIRSIEELLKNGL